ncbi:MAG: hypothetical protein SV375_13800 [Thermodesulfobacteriota bacterium]|nr:hypothetical protein [Thermodesulfobacteriota bacterium]
MKATHQRCTRCLMPRSYPGISFDGNGVCNQCKEFRKKEVFGEELLLEKIRSGARDKYDCVVGISGGRDSCYVAYLAKRKFNLRVLAVFYDSPFYCKLARQNIKDVCDTLDIDVITVTSKNNLEYNLVRNHLMSLAATGTTWGQCMFCHYGINAILFNIANEGGIPFVLSGITKHELWNPGNRMRILLKRVKQLPKSDLLRFLSCQAKAYICLVAQRRQFNFPSNNIFNAYKRAKMPSDGVDVIPFFDYVDWNHKEVERVLIEETGWTKPDEAISWRYDCSLEPLLDCTYKKEFGISTVGLYLSSLIRSGQIERDEALAMTQECEDEETLREKAESVFNFLHIPQRLQTKFFTAI